MSKNILGIDISKRKIDVALLIEDKCLSRQFDNSENGFRILQDWLHSLGIKQVHACLEATGRYSEAVAMFLHQAGHIVSVENPLRLKSYASAKLRRNKTDKADASLIAEYCLKQTPSQWLPPSAETSELQALTRRIEVLEEMLRMERNRLGTSPKQTRPSINRMIKALEKEIKQLEQAVKDHIDRNPTLKSDTGLLKSIPGIGDKTAGLLLSEIEFSRCRSARQAAAFAGLTPRIKQSGSSLNTASLSRIGSRRIRKALFFPAIVAIHHNPVIKPFASRLALNGKSKMQIVCAVMRKLIHLAFGVLKHSRPFHPILTC